MICYKDMTFCGSDCTNQKCPRYFSQQDRIDAKRWWQGCEGEPPIAFSDFTKHCAEYQPPKDT